MEQSTETPVLSEAGAIEVLAYLITAARTQLDEAAEYGPMRLMTAARKLGEQIAPHCSPPVHTLLSSLESLPLIAVPRDQREAYTATLDAICTALADCLLALSPQSSGES
jgi:hypothetical protein